MRLLKQKSHDKQPPVGRQALRDGTQDSGRRRNFTYYANRSTTETNVGREPSAVSGRVPQGPSVLSKLIHRMLAVIVVAVVVLLVVTELSLSTMPKIVVLSSASGQVFLRSQAAYQQTADALFGASITDRNKLTINTDAISSTMKHDFPELSTVTVALPVLGHRPVVYIQPSEPSMVLSTQNNGNFVLDPNGKALLSASGATAQHLSGLNVPIVTDQSGLQVEPGQTALPSTDVNFIKIVAAQLTAQHMRVTSMTLPPAAVELDVHIAGEPFYGKFNLESGTALLQVGAFVATLRQLGSQGITPHQYIDVRLDGRAYYK